MYLNIVNRKMTFPSQPYFQLYILNPEDYIHHNSNIYTSLRTMVQKELFTYLIKLFIYLRIFNTVKDIRNAYLISKKKEENFDRSHFV